MYRVFTFYIFPRYMRPYSIAPYVRILSTPLFQVFDHTIRCDTADDMKRAEDLNAVPEVSFKLYRPPCPSGERKIASFKLDESIYWIFFLGISTYIIISTSICTIFIYISKFISISLTTPISMSTYCRMLSIGR